MNEDEPWRTLTPAPFEFSREGILREARRRLQRALEELGEGAEEDLDDVALGGAQLRAQRANELLDLLVSLRERDDGER